MIRKLATLFSVLAVVAIISGVSTAEDKKENKYTTKKFMQAVKTDGLHTKVIKGEASEAETKLFAAYVKALPTNKPPKGSAESWKKLTGALAKATENHLAGKEGSAEALAKAMNCKACHTPHKVYPPKN
tara:strand:+ start:15228 stop:15614 length:387 start_codon:yes stop_codon:yes gene_type:complete